MTSRAAWFIGIMTGVMPYQGAAGIIGNIPFQNMRNDAAVIVAGVIRDIVNATDESHWTIDVLKSYKGRAAATVVGVSVRRTASETGPMRGRRGLFMLDAAGRLMGRTGSIVAGDLFVPLAEELSTYPDLDVALCIDWMRGLSNPDALILRDLAVAASDCAGERTKVERIRSHLSGSPRNADALILNLIGLAHSDPSAVTSLETWLRVNPNVAPILVENIAWGLFFYASPDATGSHALRRLAQGAGFPRVQQAAATALSMIHSDETWADLAALLDSADPEIRWIALQGLQQAVDAGDRDGEPAPFERPLVHLGNKVARSVSRRPAVPPSFRIPPRRQEAQENTLIGFWREYVSKHR